MSRRVLLTFFVAASVGLVLPQAGNACTAASVRLGDHAGYVRAVIDFTGGSITGAAVVATDAQPFDGSAALLVSGGHIRTTAAPASRYGITVRVVQGRNRLAVQVAGASGRFKYLSYAVLGGNRLSIDLWKSAPPSRSAEIRSGSRGCLTLDHWTVSGGHVSASGRATGLFENQFQLNVRGANGKVMVAQSVIAMGGRWSARLSYRQPRWQPGTLEAADLAAKDGALSCLAQVRVTLPAAGPGAAAVYVANYFGGTISQYDVGIDGALLPKNPATVKAGRDPVYMAVSPDGRNVYATNLDSDSVSQYTVGSGGALVPKVPATVRTGPGPMGIAVSPDGRNVYVANWRGNTISEYDVSHAGTLVPKPAATISTGAAPKLLAVSPDGTSLYVANQNAGTVSQYDIGLGGVLRAKSPANVKAGGSPESVAVAPDGRSVYVTAYFGRRVYQFDVGAGGKLTPKPVPSVALPGNPGFVTVSPNGKAVYVATFQRVRQYKVGRGGMLVAMTPVMVWAGSFPSSLAISSSGRDAYTSCLNGHNVYQLNVAADGRLSTKVPPSAPGEGNPYNLVILPGT